MATREELIQRKALLERQIALENELNSLEAQEAPQEKPRSFIDNLLQPPKKAVVSDIPLVDRFKNSFGNVETRPETPSVLPGVLAMGVPGSLGAMNLVSAMTDGEQRSPINEIEQFSAEIPGMLAELPSDLLKSIPGGTRASQGIGEMLGAYKDPGEGYFNDEVVKNDLMAGVPLLLPAIYATTKGASKAVSNVRASTSNGFLGDLIKNAKNFGRNSVENIPVLGPTLKDRRLEKFAANLDDIGPIVTKSKEVAGLDSADKIKKIGKTAADSYDEFSGKLLNRFGRDKGSYDSVRQSLSERIDSIPDRLAAGSPEAKLMRDKLTRLRDAVKSNPTIEEIDKFTKYFGKKANFGSANRTPEQMMYGELYHESRKDLMSAFDNAVVNAGKRTAPYKQAAAAKAGLTDDIIELNEKAAKNPLWVDSKSGRSQQIQPNWAKRTGAEKVAAAQESTRSQLDDVTRLLDDLDSGNAERGQAAAEEILRRRAEIAKNIQVQEGPIGKLADAEPGAVIDKAVSTGHLHRNLGNVDEALRVNPEYREPIRQIIIADIKDKSSDPAKLKKMLDTYEDTLNSVLTKEELTTLQKMAGVWKRPIDKSPVDEPDISTMTKVMVPFLNQLMSNNTRQ